MSNVDPFTNDVLKKRFAFFIADLTEVSIHKNLYCDKQIKDKTNIKTTVEEKLNRIKKKFFSENDMESLSKNEVHVKITDLCIYLVALIAIDKSVKNEWNDILQDKSVSDVMFEISKSSVEFNYLLEILGFLIFESEEKGYFSLNYCYENNGNRLFQKLEICGNVDLTYQKKTIDKLCKEFTQLFGILP